MCKHCIITFHSQACDQLETKKKENLTTPTFTQTFKVALNHNNNII